MEKGLVQDGVLAQDSTQMTDFWKIREGIPEACVKAGPIYKYDISLPLTHLYEIVEKMRREPCVSEKNGLVVGFGHLGDGNLHLNIMAGTAYDKDFSKKIDAIIYDYTGQSSMLAF